MAAGRARRIRRADPSRRRRQVVHIGDHVRGFRHGGDAHRRRRTGQGARPADRVLKAKNLYFVLCILGTTLPYSQLLPFLWVLVFVEGRRAGVKHLWAPIAANLAVGVSLGLPLFLYMRERRLEQRLAAP